jgi:hypothetical protein
MYPSQRLFKKLGLFSKKNELQNFGKYFHSLILTLFFFLSLGEVCVEIEMYLELGTKTLAIIFLCHCRS